MQPAIIFIRFNVILTTNRLISKTSQQIPTDIFQSRLWKSLSILFLSNQQSPTRFVYCCLIQIKVAHPHIWEAGASKYLTFLLKKWLICVPQNYVKLIDALNIFLKYVYSKFPPGKDVILLCFFENLELILPLLHTARWPTGCLPSLQKVRQKWVRIASHAYKEVIQCFMKYILVWFFSMEGRVGLLMVFMSSLCLDLATWCLMLLTRFTSLPLQAEPADRV